MSDISTSSFEFYEGIRILLPGGLAVALYGATIATFGLSAPEPQSDALLALLAALMVGLALYYIDAPSKTVFFETGRPHETLEKWGAKLPSGISSRNLFFVILDQDMPSGIRNRALYSGSIYRIGIEAIYMLAVSSLVAISVALLTAHSLSPHKTHSATTFLLLGAAAHGALLLVAGVQGFLIQRPTKPRREALKALLAGLAAQTPWSDRVAYVVSAAAATYFVCLHQEWAYIIAVVLPTGVWGFRYYKGVRRIGPTARRLVTRTRQYLEAAGAERRNPYQLAATLPLAFAGFTACLLTGLELPARSHLSDGASLGWTCASLLAVVLVVARGHEKKSYASYRTQASWLELNRSKLEKAYFPSAPGTATDEPDQR